jgi:hypothetical protein
MSATLRLARQDSPVSTKKSYHKPVLDLLDETVILDKLKAALLAGDPNAKKLLRSLWCPPGKQPIET